MSEHVQAIVYGATLDFDGRVLEAFDYGTYGEPRRFPHDGAAGPLRYERAGPDKKGSVSVKFYRDNVLVFSTHAEPDDVGDLDQLLAALDDAASP